LDGTATAAFLADKQRFPTLIRFAFNQSRVMRFFRAILEFFKWTNLAIIYKEGDPKTITLSLLPMKQTFNQKDGFEDLLKRLNLTARGDPAAGF
jgi:hypothetical protein